MTQRILHNPGILLIALNVTWATMMLVNSLLTRWLMVEGGVVEWLQVFCFALAALYCFRVAWYGDGRLVRYGFLAIGALARYGGPRRNQLGAVHF